MVTLIDILRKSAAEMRSPDHPAMLEAEALDDQELMEVVAIDLIDQAERCEKLANALELSIDVLYKLAENLDNGDDQLLKKQASAIDNILLSIALTSEQEKNLKSIAENEVDRIKNKNTDSEKKVKSELDKIKGVDEARQALKDAIRAYRPMEAPLLTRSCPDHPGAQFLRISDGVYQCSLDRKIYDFNSGFTTLKGNKIPGGQVSDQTKNFYDQRPHTIFDTREGKQSKLKD